jgi:two-component system, LuxR family, sensor kinase FixL
MNLINIYTYIFKLSKDNIAVINKDLKFVAVNQSFLKTFNKKNKEVIGKTSNEVFKNDDFDKMFSDYLLECLNGKDVDTTIWFKPQDQNYILLDLTLKYLNDNNMQSIIMCSNDVTKRVKLDMEMLELSEKIRRKIGMQLHDGISQELLGIAIKSKILSDRLIELSLPEHKDAKEIENLINEKINIIRDIAHGLFPLDVKKYNFTEFIRLVKTDLEKNNKIKCNINVDINFELKNEDSTLNFYYIIQEAIQNIKRHSDANIVNIILSIENDFIILSVKDNGIGIKNNNRGKGIGIQIMEYRAYQIGGALKINSDDSGTEIVCRFKE